MVRETQTKIEDDDDPLEDLVEDAETHRQQFSEAQKRLRAIKSDLRELVDDLEAEEAIDPAEADRLGRLIDRGEYGEVRQAIERAREGDSLAFDDEDKRRFADVFADEWERLEATVEAIRTELLRFKPDDREAMVAVVYGRHSGLRKGDIRATFDAIEDVEKTSIGADELARVLAAFNHDLNITDAREVLEAIEDEAA